MSDITKELLVVKSNLKDHEHAVKRSGLNVNTMMGSYTETKVLVMGYENLVRENVALACNLRGKHVMTGATYAHLVRRVAELEELVRQAPIFFAPQHDFEGRKSDWTHRANALVHMGMPPAPAPIPNQPADEICPTVLLGKSWKAE